MREVRNRRRRGRKGLSGETLRDRFSALSSSSGDIYEPSDKNHHIKGVIYLN
jgi:hypothetical protein